MLVAKRNLFVYLVASLVFPTAGWRANAQSMPQVSVQPAAAQIAGAIDDSKLQRLTGNPSPSPTYAQDLGLVADSFPQEHILMMLSRGTAQQAALGQFMQQQQDPRSPNFHQWLTPEQYGAFFGPSSDDIKRITGWLVQHGFTVNNVAAGGLFVDFSGTAGQITQAFHTEIHRYRIHGQERYANAGDPYIPAALAPVVSGFRALNNLHPTPQLRQPGTAHLDRASGTWSRLSAENAHLTASANNLYIAGPQDFATIYGVNQVWKEGVNATAGAAPVVGTGQTIGVVGESQIESADIQSFRDQFGITALGPNGSVEMENPPAGVCAAPNPSDNEPESYLDAEWAGAMAPDATVDFVACGRQGNTSGADLAAAYIIGDAAHVKKISVLSTSYGDCEALPNSEANQFYVALWQQAAAEGITVVVAAGDTGGDVCQSFASDVTDGISVDNEASTPYNIAVGGTDFSDAFSGTTKAYWSQTNGANFQSALSYIPEMAWNESCASPLVLERFGQGYTTSFGPNGFCTYASKQPTDPTSGFPPYFLASAGSGGQSAVSARPPWQAGVAGLPAQGGRAVPDISMFASGGYVWNQTLILCDSALANMPPGAACDFSNANDVFANFGGGTSFTAPAFAGVLALINQKNGGRQGQANYILYPLAAQQFIESNSTTQPNLTTCAAYLGAGVLSSCYFHDISGTPNPDPATQPQTPFFLGTTSVPCTGSATASGVFTDSSTDPVSNPENCFGYQITVTGSGNNLSTTANYYGVLSTANNATSPAFAAAPGYDLATGLGSPNAFALVNAPQWSALSIAPVNLAEGTVGSAYTQTLAATGRVTPYTWSVVSGSLPPGLSLAAATGVIAGTPTAPGVSSFSIQVADAEATPVTATAAFSVTVAALPTATSTALSASASSAGIGMSVTLTATVSGSGGVPTGTVNFYNGSAPIGTGALANGAATLTTTFGAAGTATIEAIYGGDATFAGSASGIVTVTIATPGFSATVNPASLQIPFAHSGVVTVTVTPQGGFTGPVSLSCATLPAYFSCGFAPSSVALTPSSGALGSTLTIDTALPPPVPAGAAGSAASGTMVATAFWLPAFAGLLVIRRAKQPSARRARAWMPAWLCLGLAGVAAMNGCGRGPHQAPDGYYTVTISVMSPGAATQTIDVPVTVQ